MNAEVLPHAHTLDLNYQRYRLADVFATLKRARLSVAEQNGQA